jgi:hypothetical protein
VPEGSSKQSLLETLPSTNAQEKLYLLFPYDSNALNSLTVPLTDDQSFGSLSFQDENVKEAYLLSTRRYRIRFFSERHHSSTVILTLAEENRPARWALDKKRSVPYQLSWTTKGIRR